MFLRADGDLGPIGEEGHLIVHDLEEAAVHSDDRARAVNAFHLDCRSDERGQRRLVIGQDSHFAFRRAGQDECRLSRPDRGFGRNHVHPKRLGHQFAFSSSRALAATSSASPTM